MQKWLLKATNGSLEPTSPYVRHDLQTWLATHEGKYVEVTPHEKVSKGKRGYFEGALIPAYCSWHEALDPANKDHRELVREMFKTEFNGTFIRGMWDAPRKVGRSTARLSNDEFGTFLERITAYFMENQIPVPDPELYKRWLDEFQDDEADYWTWLTKHNLLPDGAPI